MFIKNKKNLVAFVVGVIISLLIATTIFVLNRNYSVISRENLFIESLAETRDLRMVDGFNDAMCKSLDNAKADTCRKIENTLQTLAKEVILFLPNREKGFTLQINCMVNLDKTDQKRKCQEGVVMVLFEDNSMTVMHFYNSDISYLTGNTKLVFIEHPLNGFIYYGVGKSDSEKRLPILALEAIKGFDRDFARGTHRYVLEQARHDPSAEIYTTSIPSIVSFSPTGEVKSVDRL